MSRSADYHLHISSAHRLFDLHLRETLHYRDLILLFVKRDFTAKYKQTLLGPLWAVVQPLLTTLVFTVVFGRLAGLPQLDTAGDFLLPSVLFYMSGNICWSYLSYVIKSTSNTFINNRHTMGKVYYPRLASPISTAISGLISFGIQLVMFAGFCAFYILSSDTDILIGPGLLLLPLILLQMMLLSTGCGIIVSSVTTRYRDLAMLVDFGLQLWQYASPIAYGLSLIPAAWLPVYMINPVTTIITTFRYAVFGFGYFHIGYYLLSWLITLLLFFAGLVLFSRIERSFTDTV